MVPANRCDMSSKDTNSGNFCQYLWLNVRFLVIFLNNCTRYFVIFKKD